MGVNIIAVAHPLGRSESLCATRSQHEEQFRSHCTVCSGSLYDLGRHPHVEFIPIKCQDPARVMIQNSQSTPTVFQKKQKGVAVGCLAACLPSQPTYLPTYSLGSLPSRRHRGAPVTRWSNCSSPAMASWSSHLSHGASPLQDRETGKPAATVAYELWPMVLPSRPLDHDLRLIQADPGADGQHP